jgi:hypothetical protein
VNFFDFKRYESGQHAAVCVLDPLLLSQCIADLHFVIDVPAWTASRTRTRRSSDRALDMPAGLQSGRQLDSEGPPHGNPPDSLSSVTALVALASLGTAVAAAGLRPSPAAKTRAVSHEATVAMRSG